LFEYLVLVLLVAYPSCLLLVEGLLLEPRLEQGTAAQQGKVQPQQEELVAQEQMLLQQRLQELYPFDEQ
jgi:hypothetical protein